MAFEKFKQKGRSFCPLVAIWSRGQIGFNQGAVNLCKIKRDYYAVFFFDPEENKVGIKFTQDSTEEGAFKLNVYNTGAFVSAKAFLDYHQINHESTVKYEVTYDTVNEMFVIDLNKGLSKK